MLQIHNIDSMAASREKRWGGERSVEFALYGQCSYSCINNHIAICFQNVFFSISLVSKKIKFLLSSRILALFGTLKPFRSKSLSFIYIYIYLQFTQHRTNIGMNERNRRWWEEWGYAFLLYIYMASQLERATRCGREKEKWPWYDTHIAVSGIGRYIYIYIQSCRPSFGYNGLHQMETQFSYPQLAPCSWTKFVTMHACRDIYIFFLQIAGKAYLLDKHYITAYACKFPFYNSIGTQEIFLQSIYQK